MDHAVTELSSSARAVDNTCRHLISTSESKQKIYSFPMDHHPKQITLNRHGTAHLQLFLKLSIKHFQSFSLSVNYPHIQRHCTNARWLLHHHSKMYISQCFQKERLRKTHLVPLTLKAMITFISATYYLFLKPYNHN